MLLLYFYKYQNNKVSLVLYFILYAVFVVNSNKTS